MWRVLRTFLTPRWIAIHIAVWAAVLAMVWLGRWQLEVSNRKHFDLQNFSYTLQWWAFCVAAIWFWVRLLRDARREPLPPAPTTALAVDVLSIGGATTGGAEVVSRQQSRLARTVGAADLVALGRSSARRPAVYRGYLMPQSSSSPARSDADPTHGAYNDYLWELALADRAQEPHPQAETTADPTPAPGLPADNSDASRQQGASGAGRGRSHLLGIPADRGEQ